MKAAILALCLLGAAFAAPIADNFIDPDCIEEDVAVEEPSQEIEADFALGVPDLVLDVAQASNNDEECEDELEPTEAQFAPIEMTEECESEEEIYEAEPVEAGYAAPEDIIYNNVEEVNTEECEDEPIPTTEPVFAPTDAVSDCQETEEVTDEVPFANPASEPNAEDCAEDVQAAEPGQVEEAFPALDIHIEPASVDEQQFFMPELAAEAQHEPIEECEY